MSAKLAILAVGEMAHVKVGIALTSVVTLFPEYNYAYYIIMQTLMSVLMVLTSVIEMLCV